MVCVCVCVRACVCECVSAFEFVLVCVVVCVCARTCTLEECGRVPLVAQPLDLRQAEPPVRTHTLRQGLTENVCLHALWCKWCVCVCARVRVRVCVPSMVSKKAAEFL